MPAAWAATQFNTLQAVSCGLDVGDIHYSVELGSRIKHRWHWTDAFVPTWHNSAAFYIYHCSVDVRCPEEHCAAVSLTHPSFFYLQHFLYRVFYTLYNPALSYTIICVLIQFSFHSNSPDATCSVLPLFTLDFPHAFQINICLYIFKKKNIL